MSGGNMNDEEKIKLAWRYNNNIDAEQFRKQLDEIVKALDIDYYNKHKGEEEE